MRTKWGVSRDYGVESLSQPHTNMVSLTVDNGRMKARLWYLSITGVSKSALCMCKSADLSGEARREDSGPVCWTY